MDTARGIAILGMIATHIFPLIHVDVSGMNASPTWAGWAFTGVSSALFVVLAGVGLSILTANTTHVTATRKQLTVRALVLMFIGLLLGMVESYIAIILVHYGVMFLLAMWFITLSRKALTITAVTWLVVSPIVHGVFTRFMQLQAGGTVAYIEEWRLWHSPTLVDVFTQPFLTLWDVLFTGFYPVISFFGYVLVGMAIGRADLAKRSTALFLLISGVVTYVVCRGVSRWLLTDDAFVSRIAHATDVASDEVSIYAATGSGMETGLLMGAPEWFGLAVPHSGAPLDIYSTAGAAAAAIGFFVLLSRSRIAAKLLFPITATGTIALTAYTLHIVLRGLWPSIWEEPLAIGDPAWADVWIMLLVHWGVVIALGVIIKLLGKRGPLEGMLRQLSNSVGRSSS
ncbi:heparan-alpha-glucosaminide N-acetyltransferase domain-containing protein [Enteractinococcus coprophilus]|uniref:heparan-alpha-glucosaminide N-acetyltransferase domain-containing protein n=1 Tax=Enteractinococcus coprophilus TaxID=1027633 RepID=UPI001476B8D2|nr:heparan-alpha-glucosaminide N-acetyltransferase domain-containing protein [Enteractinococcus coprophilus]